MHLYIVALACPFVSLVRIIGKVDYFLRQSGLKIPSRWPNCEKRRTDAISRQQLVKEKKKATERGKRFTEVKYIHLSFRMYR